MYTNAQEYEETEIAKVSNEIESYISGSREYKGKLELYDSGFLSGTADSNGRSVNKNLETGKYIVVLTEFSACSEIGQDVQINLTNVKNSYELLKKESCNKAINYFATSVLGTYYLEINEEEIINLIGKDKNTGSDTGAGLIYQIFKII